MAGYFDAVADVIEELKKRGYDGDRKRVTEAMTKLGLSCPLDDQAIGELAQELGVAKSDAARHLVRTKKILTSQKWHYAVDRVRGNRIPKGGYDYHVVRR